MKKKFFEAVFLFVVGCIFGYLFETVLCFFQFGKYESRQGLIYGPFNPIYGFAFLLVPLLLKKHREKPLKLFFLSFFYGGVFEYFCSWVQETFFGTISWDYQKNFMNFDGRTCLRMMVVWGVIGFVFVRYCYPFLSKLADKVNEKYYLPVGIFLTVLLVLDMLLSSLAVFRERMRFEGKEPVTFLGEWLDKTYPSSYLDEIYPHRMKPDTKKELRTIPELHP